jgi:hypothetical protein
MPQLQYEGFEPSPYETGDKRVELEDVANPVSTPKTTRILFAYGG